MGRKKQTVAHLLTHTIKEGDCFVWQSCKDKDGYGVSSIAGKKMPAHRAAYILTNPEEDINGKYILHKAQCKSRACINVEHLYAGTQKQNIQDQIDAGTFVKGELNGKSKLTEADVVLIRSSKLSNRELATYFNVSYSTIWDARNRRWLHVM